MEEEDFQQKDKGGKFGVVVVQRKVQGVSGIQVEKVG